MAMAYHFFPENLDELSCEYADWVEESHPHNSCGNTFEMSKTHKSALARHYAAIPHRHAASAPRTHLVCTTAEIHVPTEIAYIGFARYTFREALTFHLADTPPFLWF